jgi:hypothetical protein
MPGIPNATLMPITPYSLRNQLLIQLVIIRPVLASSLPMCFLKLLLRVLSTLLLRLFGRHEGYVDHKELPVRLAVLEHVSE